jgi:class 3 adenylate cyclase
MSDPELDARIDEAVAHYANLAIGRAAKVALALALSGLVATHARFALDNDPIWLPPMLAPALSVPVLFIVMRLASAGRLDGQRAYAAMLGISAVPGIAIGAGLLLPGGVAVYIHGSFGWVWLFLIAVSGLYLDRRLTLVTSVWCALQYAVLFALAKTDLLALSGPPDVVASLTSSFIAGVKATVLVLSGFVIGGIGDVSRALVRRVLTEQEEKENVRRVFGQYVSEEVSEHLLAERSQSGRRVEVVVLFSDLRGFTSFSEGRDPAEVVDRLNAYLERMVEAVRAEGGVVDKFIGDAIMAVFGGVVEVDRPADRALAAARRMRQALRDLNAEWSDEGIEPFDNGIGMHLGGVLQGPIGSQDRKEFTVIGDAVNMAARLEGLTRNHEQPILLTDALRQALSPEAAAQLDDLGELQVKGRAQPIRVFGTK